LVKLTFAPGTAAPDESATVPLMDAVATWAWLTPGKSNTTAWKMKTMI
jgi:hypothetical protein